MTPSRELTGSAPQHTRSLRFSLSLSLSLQSGTRRRGVLPVLGAAGCHQSLSTPTPLTVSLSPSHCMSLSFTAANMCFYMTLSPFAFICVDVMVRKNSNGQLLRALVSVLSLTSCSLFRTSNHQPILPHLASPSKPVQMNHQLSANRGSDTQTRISKTQVFMFTRADEKNIKWRTVSGFFSTTKTKTSPYVFPPPTHSRAMYSGFLDHRFFANISDRYLRFPGNQNLFWNVSDCYICPFLIFVFFHHQ